MYSCGINLYAKFQVRFTFEIYGLFLRIIWSGNPKVILEYLFKIHLQMKHAECSPRADMLLVGTTLMQTNQSTFAHSKWTNSIITVAFGTNVT